MQPAAPPVPLLPPRTRLYPLPPFGLGTGLVESLTSYFGDLADTHAVMVGDLFGKELSLRKPGRMNTLNPHDHGFRAQRNWENGTSERTESLVTALQSATGLHGLARLTLLPLKGVLGAHALLRRYRAWCSICLDEWRKRSQNNRRQVHEPLLWTLAVVKACHIHKCALQDVCPRCKKKLNPLPVGYLPGHCEHCGAFLGELSHARSDASSHDVWVAGEVAALLAESSAGKFRAGFLENLRWISRNWFDCNEQALADFVGLGSNTVHSWVAGARPTLSSLLHLCYKLGVSLRVLVQQVPEGQEYRTFGNRPELPKRPVAKYQSATQIAVQLHSALDEANPRSVSDVASSMGYQSPERLYQADREKCKQIARQFRRSGQSHAWKKRGAQRKASLDVIEKRLNDSMASDNPESAYRIARNLGYANAGYIWIRFPEKCRAIAARLNALELQRIESFKLALEAALKAPTPVSLESVRRELGLSASTVLRSHFPDLCDQLIDRYKTFSRSIRVKHAISAASEVISSTDTPLSGAELVRRTGGSRWMLEQYAGDLINEAKKTRIQRRKIERDARMATLESDCLIIALCLQFAGLTPSFPRVEELLPPDSLPSWPDRHRAFHRARERLALLPALCVR